MKKQFFLFLIVAAAMWNCTDHEVEVTKKYELDASKSVAQWKGYLKTGYFNEGTIAVKSESLVVSEGKVSGGSFTIPVSSIINLNLPVDSLKEMLVHHLQSPDFFNMALHPNVKYDITTVAPYSGSNVGDVTGANFLVSGSLTILGKSNAVSFPAKIDISDDSIYVEGKVKFDRTKFGINFASDPALPAENYIEPLIDVHLKLSGSKK